MKSGTAPSSIQRETTIGWLSLAVFVISSLLLFLGMDRWCNLYDEGLVLTDAMYVAAGAIPHRDFYVNYGPAQFYFLAGLFKLFGQSVLIERILDITVKAGIATVCFWWCAQYCRKSVALIATIVMWMWLYSFQFYGSPQMPTVLLSLVASALLLPQTGKLISWRTFAAGAVTGLTALFRYDIGFGLLVAHTAFIVFNAVSGPKTTDPYKAAALQICRYIAGTAIVFVPVAVLYLTVAPLHAFLYDIVLFQGKYYARARNLPFPGIHLHSLDDLVVYLPIAVLAILLFRFAAHRRDAGGPSSSLKTSRSLEQFLVLLALLIVVFYAKGLVRVSPYHMFVSIAPALIVLAVLSDRLMQYRPALRYFVLAVVLFAVATPVWAARRTAKAVFFLRHMAVGQELISPPGAKSIRNVTYWCGVPNPLHKGLCFLVDPDHINAIVFIDSHTSPSDRLFVGLAHHDRIYMNDILTYFTTQRLPATRWYHFDPDLQTRADIQSEMISDLRAHNVPYIILDSEFEYRGEANNDSSKSTGVHLLDDYIRDNYHPVRTFGELSIVQKNIPAIP